MSSVDMGLDSAKVLVLSPVHHGRGVTPIIVKAREGHHSPGLFRPDYKAFGSVVRSPAEHHGIGDHAMIGPIPVEVGSVVFDHDRINIHR